MSIDYDNFVFYGSWRTLLEGFPEDTAKEILWNIMTLGTAGDLDTDNPMVEGIVMGAIAPNIKAAQGRYTAAVENGRKGGKKKTVIDEVLLKEMIGKGMTHQAIAEHFGVSAKTIQRRLRELDNSLDKTGQLDKRVDRTGQNLDIDIDIDIYKDIDKEKDKENISAVALPGGSSLKLEDFENQETYKRAIDMGF